MKWERISLVVMVLGMPTWGYALGLGEIERKSALNEPFRANIAIIGAKADELDNLQVKLADAERFRRAGLERPEALSQLRFAVVKNGSGQSHIQVTSQQPIRDPFLNLLLEVNWAKGRLYREYTVLLDPPVYDPSVKVVKRTRDSERHRDREPIATTAPETEEVTASPEHKKPETAPARKEPRVAAKETKPHTQGDEAAHGPTTGGGSTYGPTRAGDTLAKIATKVRHDRGVSVPQVMLALLRTNPQAFYQENINNLKRGFVLQVPDTAIAKQTSRAEALHMVRQQHVAWEQYRQTASLAPTRRAMGAGGKPATAARAEEAGPTADTGSEDRLKLVTAAKEGNKTGATITDASGADGDIRKELVLAREELAAKRKENAELNERVAEADKLIQLLQKQAKLKDDEMATLQSKLSNKVEPLSGVTTVMPGKTKPIDNAAVPPPIGGDTEAGKPAESSPPVADNSSKPAGSDTALPPPTVTTPDIIKPETASTTPPEQAATAPSEETSADDEGGLLGMIPGGALTLGGLAAGLGLLGGLMAWQKRRRAASDAELPKFAEENLPPEELAESPMPGPGVQHENVRDEGAFSGFDLDHSDNTQEIPISDVTASRKPGDGKATAALSMDHAPSSSPAMSESAADDLADDDDLAEVNIYLAYERFSQAEDLVKKAIEAHPNQHKYKLRLLEVYYAANDKAAYERYAKVLHDAVGGSGQLWESALAMWNEMSPDRALFSAAPAQVESTPVAPASTFFDPTSGTAKDSLAAATLGTAAAAGAVAAAGAAAVSSKSNLFNTLDFNIDSNDPNAFLGLAEKEERDSPSVLIDTNAMGHHQDSGDIDMSPLDADFLDLTSPSWNEPEISLDGDLSDQFSLKSREEERDEKLSSTMQLGQIGGGRNDDETARMVPPKDKEPLEWDNQDPFATLQFEADSLATRETPAANDAPSGHVQASDVSGFWTSLGSPTQNTPETPVNAQKTDDTLSDLADSLNLAESYLKQNSAKQPWDNDDFSIELDEKSLSGLKAHNDPEDITLSWRGNGAGDDGTAFSMDDLESTLARLEALSAEDTEFGAFPGENETKLDLARTYLEVGDKEGARSILDEIVEKGTDEQRNQAKQLLQALG